MAHKVLNASVAKVGDFRNTGTFVSILIEGVILSPRWVDHLLKIPCLGMAYTMFHPYLKSSFTETFFPSGILWFNYFLERPWLQILCIASALSRAVD